MKFFSILIMTVALVVTCTQTKNTITNSRYQSGQQDPDRSKKISLIGHRGDMSLRATNSIASFKRARSLGLQGVEFDVHYTKDRQVVVMHSPYLRFTTKCGKGRINKKTFRQLQQCDLVNGEPIRTLEEVIVRIKDWFSINFLEIKTNDRRARQQTRDVVRILRKHNVQDTFIIISYNDKALRYLAKKKFRDITVGSDSFDSSSLDFAIRHRFKYALMPERNINPALVQKARVHNVQLVAYKVYTIKEFKQLRKNGVFYFIIDNNRKFSRYLKSTRKP